MYEEYIGQYANDPLIIALRSKIEIVVACRKAAIEPNDNVAVASVLAAHPNANELFMEGRLLNLIQTWRKYRADTSAYFEIDKLLFGLEQDIRRRVEHLSFEDLNRPLMLASPVQVDGITRLQLLQTLFPNGESVLMLDSSKAKEGAAWNTKLEEDIGGMWFWPFPIKAGGDENEMIDKRPESVISWSSATANFSGDGMMKIRDQIISRQIPVRLVMDTAFGTTIVFAIEAKDKKEWGIKCRELRKTLKNLGVDCPPFRYDWVAPMNNLLNRVVYLRP